jgi:hypothetical protein
MGKRTKELGLERLQVVRRQCHRGIVWRLIMGSKQNERAG